MARTVLNLPLIVFVISLLFFNSMLDTPTVKAGNILPDFRDFAQPVENSDVNTLSGVYVPNVLALPVIQQPSGDDGYVSNKDDQTTQFAMASQFGSVGLLAHNYLSGRFFSELAVGQEVRLVYGNGRVEYFVITEILRYQALEPNSQLSSFRSLDHSEILSAEQMFKRVYAGERHVTFQTCIAANGTVSWGRLFIVAEPKQFSFDHLVEQILQ
jgi:hypothetical protein